MTAILSCFFTQGAIAQEFVRSVPTQARINGRDRHGLYSTEELGGAPATTEADDTYQPAGTLSTEETDRLVEQYRREAGPLGPSKWFSASKVGFHFGVDVAWDDNIRANTGQHQQADEITTLVGGVTVSLGDYQQRLNSFLVFDYALRENIFAIHTDEDALDQSGLLDAMYRKDRLAVEFTSRFQSSHDPTNDTGQRERRYLFDEIFSTRYRYGDKTILSSVLSFTRTDASLGTDHQQYAWEGDVDYQVFNKVKLGVGVQIGRLEAEGGLQETFEDPLLRLEYLLTDKIAVLAQVGVDFRERGARAGDEATPVFALQTRWTPYDGTTLSLSGFRRVDASEAFEGEDLINTSVQFDVRQRFYRHFYFVANLGYTHADYGNVTRVNGLARTDNYFVLRGGVTYEAAKYLDVGFYYQHREDDSTQAIYSYASNRIYLQSNFFY